ncbi:MAG: helix-turn-helix transcriptional regulator [Sphaerobacter thermophilus]
MVRNRVREARQKQGWTQDDLGRRVGVSRQTINAIENGRYDPSLPLAFKLARVFETTIEDLFFPEETPVT